MGSLKVLLCSVTINGFTRMGSPVRLVVLRDYQYCHWLLSYHYFELLLLYLLLNHLYHLCQLLLATLLSCSFTDSQVSGRVQSTTL